MTTGTVHLHHMDARVGGTYQMSFRNFGTGNGHLFSGKYLELAPFEKIRYSGRFDDPNLPGQMYSTITLRQVSLVQLAKPVEPEIPN